MALPLLLRLGNAPSAPSQGGVKSLLAFWIGGAASTQSGVEPPPPPTDDGGAGGRIVGGSFSRKKWRDRRDELAREAAKAVRSVVREASAVAEQVAADVELAPYAPLLAPYTKRIEQSFESAATAKTYADAAMHAAHIAHFADLIRREIAAQEDEEDALLLLI